MKLILFILIFLLTGAFFIISNENLILKNPDNVDKFFSLYAKWIDQLTDNFSGATGYLVKMEWLPNVS